MQSNLEVLESLTLTIDPAAMKASSMGDLVLIYSREQGSCILFRRESFARELSFRQQRILADLCEGLHPKGDRPAGGDFPAYGWRSRSAALKKIVPTLASLCRGTRPIPGIE